MTISRLVAAAHYILLHSRTRLVVSQCAAKILDTRFRIRSKDSSRIRFGKTARGDLMDLRHEEIGFCIRRFPTSESRLVC